MDFDQVLNPPADKTRKIYQVFLLIVLIILSVKAALVLHGVSQNFSRDYFRWYLIGQRALEGKPLANPAGAQATGIPEGINDGNFYKLPPAFGLFCAPLALLPYTAYICVYYALSAACGAVAVLMAMKLLHGRAVPDNPWLLVAPTLMILPFAVDDLHCGNNNMIVLACMLGGFYLSSRGKNLLGGLSIGMAVSLKLFPAAAVALAVMQRRWKLVAFSILGTLIWSLAVPMLIRGPESTIRDNLAWIDRIVAPYAKAAPKVQWQERGTSVSNQSVFALIERFTRHVTAIEPGGGRKEMFINVIDLPLRQVRIIEVSLLALAAGCVFWVCRAPRPADARLADSAEFALLSVFILLASPIAWTYFFTLLLLPVTVGVYVAIVHRQTSLGRWCAWLLLATVVLSLASLSKWPRMGGSLTWTGIIWFVMSCVIRRRAAELSAPAVGEPLNVSSR